MERGFRGARADLSDLARHLLDIACFFSPLVLAPTYADSPRPPSRVLAGILSDFAEIRGGLRSGLSRLFGAAAAFRNPPTPPDRERGSRESRTGGVSEEVLEFVMDLVECPESWLEFPVPVDDVSLQIVDSMRLKLKEMQHRVDTQSPSFGAHSFPLMMSGADIQLEDDQAQEASAITKTTSQQSICQWFEVPGDVGNTTYGEKQSRMEDFSFSETGDGNIVLMERYMDQLLAEGGLVDFPSSSYQWDQLRKPIPGDDHDKAVHCTPQIKTLFDEESGDWHAVDDFDFEVVGGASVGKIM